MSAANWGFEWGDAAWGEEQIQARARLLAFVRNTNLSALVNTFADRTEDFLDTASDVAASIDLDNATGVHLDRLGALLQLPRYGASDERYRVLLRVQSQLILSSTTTTPVVLRIVALFSGQNPTMYSENYPMGFAVGAVVAEADVPLLLELLGKAKAAAYEVTLVASFNDEFLIADYTHADPIDGAGVVDYTHADPVADAPSVSYEYTV